MTRAVTADVLAVLSTPTVWGWALLLLADAAVVVAALDRLDQRHRRGRHRA